jgi:putative transposase
MRELHFTQKDIQQRRAEGKRLFWEGVDGLSREAVRMALEEGLDWEIKEQLRVKWYGRSEGRTDWRNGYTERGLRTRWGAIEKLRVPRSRRGRYQSVLVERYSRWGGDFEEVVEQAVMEGLSMRRAEKLLRSWFGQVFCSASAISAVVKKLTAAVSAFHRRPLTDDFVYLFLDGFSTRIRRAFKRPYTALMAWGMRADGATELIDFQVATSEKTIFCQSLLESLYQRGLTGKNLRLIVIDGAEGFAEAAAWIYGRVPQQVCIVHRLRNVNKYLKGSPNRRRVMGEAKAVFAAPSKTQALFLARRFIQRWKQEEPRAVRCFARNLDASLTFYDQPQELWSRLKSTNPLERTLREFRRRVRLVDSFPDIPTAERWLYAIARRLNQKPKKICPGS